MGRLTEDLRSPGICRGCDYELQGSEAKKEASPGGVTADVAGYKIGPDGPLMKGNSTLPLGNLKTQMEKG